MTHSSISYTFLGDCLFSTTDGGNIFGIRVHVLHICPPMVKVFPPAPAPAFGAGGKKPPLHGGNNPRVSFGGGDHNNGGNGGGGPVKLDGTEGQLLRQMIASRRGIVVQNDDDNNDDCGVRRSEPQS